jgi:predicted nucleotidyltransferase
MAPRRKGEAKERWTIITILRVVSAYPAMYVCPINVCPIMKPKNLSPGVLDQIAHRLARETSVTAAYVLGSSVEGRVREDSDVDIALLPARGEVITPEERLALAADLGESAGREADVGVLSTANLVYAKEAVTRGRLIFERDPSARARFAMLVLSMYASLQETRREVLHAYAA